MVRRLTARSPVATAVASLDWASSRLGTRLGEIDINWSRLDSTYCAVSLAIALALVMRSMEDGTPTSRAPSAVLSIVPPGRSAAAWGVRACANRCP
jgi:hypothetical protein